MLNILPWNISQKKIFSYENNKCQIKPYNTPIFYKNQHTFWKGYIKNQNVLDAFKKAFLVLKFNFLFPKSLDILKE